MTTTEKREQYLMPALYCEKVETECGFALSVKGVTNNFLEDEDSDAHGSQR